MLLDDVRKFAPDAYTMAGGVQCAVGGLTVYLGKYLGDGVVELSEQGQVLADANKEPEPEVTVVKAKKSA